MDNAQIELVLNHLLQHFEQVKSKLPEIAGNEIVNFALDNFQRQGFMGDVFKPWKKRKSVNWGKKNKKGNRAILVLRGHLRASIRVTEANWNIVKVGSSIPYAKVHNEGLRVGQIQRVSSFTRKQTYSGVAGKFKVGGDEYITGSNMSLKTRKTLKPAKAHTSVRVKSFIRRINQNIPARPYLAKSQYLNARLQRTIGAEILRGLKNLNYGT